MIKKDMYFTVTKHWIIIIPLIIFIMINSLHPQVEKPTVAVLGNFEPKIEKKINEMLNVEKVDSVKEGKYKVERSIVDAFVLIEDGKVTIFRNDNSIRSYYVKPAIEKVLNTSPIQIKYLDKENVKKEDIYFLFSLFIFIAFALPALLFQDEKDVIDAILLSPVKNREIVLSKVKTTTIILVLLNFFYLFYVGTLKLNLFFVIVAIGLIYVAIGTFFGIFYDNKYISFLIYPLMLFFVILPLFPNPLSGWIKEIIDLCIFSSKIPLLSIIKLFITFIILLLLSIFAFEIKIKMRRTKG